MRNVVKAIEEYKNRYAGTRDASFHLSDLREIMRISRDITPTDTLFNVCDNSMMLGFMIGYRKCQSDMKKARVTEEKSATRAIQTPLEEV